MADTSSKMKYRLMQALQEKGPPSQKASTQEAEFQPLGEWDYVGEEGEGMDTERGLTEEEFAAQEERIAARKAREKQKEKEGRPITKVNQARKVSPTR